MDSTSKPSEYLIFSLVMLVGNYRSSNTLDPEVRLIDQIDKRNREDLIRIKIGLIAFEMHHGLEIPSALIHENSTLQELACSAMQQPPIPDEMFDSFLEIKLTALDQLALQSDAVGGRESSEMEINPVNWRSKD
jgi:hypothetical protein